MGGSRGLSMGAVEGSPDRPRARWHDRRVGFEATLVRWSGEAAWVFAPVPDAHAPDVAGPFGRVPVVATVDGLTWATSVWTSVSGSWASSSASRARQERLISSRQVS